jgi:hypothetical protein
MSHLSVPVYHEQSYLVVFSLPLPVVFRYLLHGYEKPNTTDQLWATGLGARAKRSKPERGKSPERLWNLLPLLRSACLFNFDES